MTDFIQVKRFPITNQVRDFVFNRDGYICRYCGSKNKPFHLDHVYPVAKGGETSIDNLVTSCSRCNSKKHASVGIWPKPIGYFDEKEKPKGISIMSLVLLLAGFGTFISGYLLLDSYSYPSPIYVLNKCMMLLGIAFIMVSIGRLFTEVA